MPRVVVVGQELRNLDRIVRIVVSRLVRRFVRGEVLPKEVLASFERPMGLFAAALLFGLLLPVIGLERGARTVLDLSAGFVATVAGVWAAFRLVDVFCDYLKSRASRTRNRFDDMLVPLARRTLKIFVLILVLSLFLCPSSLAFHLTLQWDPNVDEDLAGYIVYYGTASGHYRYDVDIGDQTSCTISGLAEGTRYYFAVTAYDEEGKESTYSRK